MTPACPRCQSPLNGPVCAACGLRVDGSPQGPGAPGTPPPGGYPPGPPPAGYAPPGAPGYGAPAPGMQPGMQMGPGGVPYMMVPVPTELPSLKWAMTGGIMGIVLSSLQLLIPLIFLAVIASGDVPSGLPGVGAVTAMMVVWALLATFGIVSGVYSVKGRWGGALASGIFHTLIALLCLLGAIGNADSPDPDKGASIAVAVVLFLLSALTAAFCYAGISGAKARARYRGGVHAAQAF